MIVFSDVSYAYEGASGDALHDVSLVVSPGERVVVVGDNGSGKSTLARLANGALTPRAGSVTVDGEPPLPGRVAVVRQDPLSQVVGSTVLDDVCLGPANLGLPADEVRERAREALVACGIARLADERCAWLSLGEQQLVALAGALALRAPYLVLDEVTSQLGDEDAGRVAVVVDELVAAGAGILEVAHDLGRVKGATRVVRLAGGSVVERPSSHGAPKGNGGEDPHALPDEARGQHFGDGIRRADGGRADVTAADADGPDAEPNATAGPSSVLPAGLADHEPVAGHVLAATDLVVVRGGRELLCKVSVEVHGGLVVVTGPSGAGKSVLARALAGVEDLAGGCVRLDGTPVRAGMVGLATQRPLDQLFCDTVAEDVAFAPRAAGLGDDESRRVAAGCLREMGLPESLWGRSPFDVSGGQERRVALAGVLAQKASAVVLDEPLAGLDLDGQARVLTALGRLCDGGMAVVVVTHDPEPFAGLSQARYELRGGRCARVA